MMKKLFVALALFPLVASANDLSVGTFELAGGSNLAFNSGSTKDTTAGVSSTTDETEYGLGLTGLYYVMPNLGIGARLGYSKNIEEFPSGAERKLTAFFFGPAVSYEAPVAPQLAVFGRGFLGYASGKTEVTNVPNASASGFGFGLEGGVKYFVVKNFSFDVGVGYDWVKMEDDETPKTETTVSGFGLNVGLSVYFGGK